MKENKLSIIVGKPTNAVFEFTANPSNTPRWIEHLEIEETNEWPPKIGTIYRNRGASGEWSEYIVSALKVNKILEMVSKDGNYHVRYTYRKLGEGETEMVYLEWVNKGELEQPFTQNILNKLKTVIENK